MKCLSSPDLLPGQLISYQILSGQRICCPFTKQPSQPSVGIISRIYYRIILFVHKKGKTINNPDYHMN
jgi:hypothetical protein